MEKIEDSNISDQEQKEKLTNIRLANSSDYAGIRALEEHSFGNYVLEEESELIVGKGYGQIYLAFDENKLIGYQVILYKEYGDKDGEVESYLQPLLKEAREKDSRVMHDDVHFNENKFVYFHLLGTEPGYQNIGVSQKLKQHALQNMPLEHAQKEKMACIRVNNLPSIKVNMKILGLCMVSLKPIDTSMIGSRETNFNAISGQDYLPMLDPSKIETREIFTDENNLPDSPDFLIPVKNGGESELPSTNVLKLLKKVFDEGYVIRGLFRAADLNLEGDSYFYCTKSSNSR